MGDKRAEVLRQDRDRFLGFAFAAADLLLELDGDLRITWVGGAARSLLGVDSAEVAGKSLSQFVSQLDARMVADTLHDLGLGERKKDIILTLESGPGSVRPVVAFAYRSLNAMRPEYCLSISSRHAGDAPASSRHARDRATGLIEAVQFAETTASVLRTARAAGQSARLTLVQICGEAELGRLLGPQRSQALLSEIGTQLRRHAIGPEAAAKLGDGRFSVAQLGGESPRAITEAIARLGRSYDLDSATLAVSETSLDFHAASLAEDDVESILSHVLEKFRTEGSKGIAAGSAESYLRKMTAETVSRVVMMRDVIHEKRLSLHYQPIVVLTDRSVHHYEVLLRFADGHSPFEDIQFAEQINTIHEVDLAVAQGAIARLENADGPADLSLAVNMSARSLLNDNFLAMFDDLAARLGDRRDRLIIEVTESAKLEDLAKAAKAVERLTAKGHPVCLDDFGAGASSLPYLQQLVVDYVKIDGAYVRGLDVQARERAIIEGVLAACRSLGVATVAEMVEREDQHKILLELGVTLGQGWLYGRPAPEIVPGITPGIAEPAQQVRVPKRLDPAAISRMLVKRNP